MCGAGWGAPEMASNESFMGHARRAVFDALRSKLCGRSEANNGTGGQRRSFLLTTPVASMRLEELLVRSVCVNPVRKNRQLTRGGRAKRWSKPFRKTIRDTKAYFAGNGGSARMRSLVLRHF